MSLANAFRRLLTTALALTGLFVASSALAATITVTGTGDTIAVDGAVTLREAITSINNGANLNADVVAVGAYGTNDTINFNISGAGVHTIALAATLPDIVKPVTINGYSQPGTSANTLAVGDNAVLLIEIDATNAGLTPALTLSTGSSGSTIKGLVINRNAGGAILVWNGSGGNTISGNFLGTNPAGSTSSGTSIAINFRFNAGNGNVVGGTAPAARNVLAGGGAAFIDMEGGTGNVVQGNYLGVNAAGTAAIGAVSDGIFLSQNASGTTIGGTASGAGNVMAGFARFGIAVGTINDVIQGNFIGTNAIGTAVLGGGQQGISIEAPGTIGGSAAGAGNLISGSTIGILVFVDVGSGPVVIQGNKIGTDVTGTSPLGNSNCGILVLSSGGLIGGVNAGEGNIIAFNGTQGVTIGGSAVGWVVLGNSIFDNVGMGIALRPDSSCDIALQGAPGQTGQPNDTCDTDTGSNDLQNYPVITAVTTGVGTTNIQGTLNSLANNAFRVEFFASPTCDASGFGEGKTFLGSTTVVTNGACNGSFNVTVPFGTAGQSITATATLLVNSGAGFQKARPLGLFTPAPLETSEFSQCFLQAPAPTNTPTNTTTPIPATVTSTPAPVAAVVPTLSPSMLGLLALALLGAALFLVRRS